VAYEDGDALLFILSAWRKTSWPSFGKAFDDLHTRKVKRQRSINSEPLRYLRFRAARLLVSLGHCDVDFRDENKHLIVAPAMLAALPAAGLPRAVLCGARSSETTIVLRKTCTQIGQAIRIEISSQDDRASFAPSRIEIEGESNEALNHLADKLRIPYSSVPPCWAITKLSGSLEEYLKSLKFTQQQELNWEREDFDPERLIFTLATKESDGLRLSRYRDPVRLQWIYRLWQRQMSAEVDPSWGRFAILRAAGQGALRYNNTTGVVAVPRGTPLPPLLTRALTLCSGYAPQFVRRSNVVTHSRELYGFELYIDVPPDVLTLVASKVGQQDKIEQFVLEGSKR
jgi:hypothetical protein